jgi:hypothetical protein
VHCCFILSTEPRGLPSVHWLSFFYNHYANMLEYFDSYALTLDTYADVHKSLCDHGLIPLCTLANTLGSQQSDVSLVCGHYCIAYLCWRGSNTLAPVTRFSVSLARRHRIGIRRDKHVVQLVRDLLRRGNCCLDMQERSDCSQSCTCAAKQRWMYLSQSVSN